MFKRKLNEKILNSIWITSLLVILLVFTFAASSNATLFPSFSGLTRPGVVGANGLVISDDILASQAGLQILMKGGNAIDAIVAVATTLNVVDIGMSGIDGNGFATIYWAPENKVYSLGLTGAVPYAADSKELTQDDVKMGFKAGCVPGAFGGWIEALQRFGTMSLKEVMESAIHYAKEGFQIKPDYYNFSFSRSIENNKTIFELFPTSARLFLPNGRVPQEGEMFYMKDLANTFKKLVDAEQMALARGKSRNEALQAAFDRFYKGDIAQEVVRFYSENNGLFTLKDFADYKPVWKEPLHSTYRGYDIYTSPSTSRSGYELIMTANLMEGFDVQELGHNSAEYLHLLAECMKLAKSDIYHYVADEDFVNIPTEAMLSKEYAAVRRELIDLDKAMLYPDPGDPDELKAIAQGLVSAYSSALQYDNEPIIDDVATTTNFDVIDRFGNTVAATMTHGSLFGTKLIVGNTGMLFNNGSRWGSVSPYEGDANELKGGKIALLGNGPTIVMKDGKLVMSYGTPGGEGIGIVTTQLLFNIINFGMSLQKAIESPEIVYIKGKPDLYVPGVEITWYIEETIPDEVIKELEDKGHDILRVTWTEGKNGILLNPEYGTYVAGSDPRRDGYAVGY